MIFESNSTTFILRKLPDDTVNQCSKIEENKWWSNSAALFILNKYVNETKSRAKQQLHNHGIQLNAN